jgi:hypothetical protein
MDAADLPAARASLRKREGIPEKHEEKYVATWSVGQESPPLMPALDNWAHAHGLGHVVWTNLPPRFNDVEVVPRTEEVVQYLRGLTGARRDSAERYVRFAPRQVDTAYRREIEAALGWSAREARSDE